MSTTRPTAFARANRAGEEWTSLAARPRLRCGAPTVSGMPEHDEPPAALPAVSVGLPVVGPHASPAAIELVRKSLRVMGLISLLAMD